MDGLEPQALSSGRIGARLLLLSPLDNTLVATGDIGAGETVDIDGGVFTTSTQISRGHKVARREIAVGDKIYKYGAPIGSATAGIAPGEHVHTHNIKSDYTPTYTLEAARAEHEREGTK